jgi:predicted enzyme related to lactoylglutathione lyase
LSVSVIVYPATDLPKAKEFYRGLLKTDPYADSEYYVGFRTGEFEIGLDPNGHQYGPGAIAFWDVPDIAASAKALEEVGGTIVQPPTDVGYGMLVSRIKDPNGALVGLRQLPAR